MNLRCLLALAALAGMSGGSSLPASTLAKPPAAEPSPTPAGDQIGVIPGLTIPRANGNFLGLELTSARTFKLSFYDAKKNPLPADVKGAVFRWPVRYQPNAERTLLTRSADGLSLESPKSVRSPLSFKLYISLLIEGKDTPVETFIIDYNG